MPVLSLSDLQVGPRLEAMARQLSTLPPGLVLTAGQQRSGKETTLIALARELTPPDGGVTLLSDREGHLDVHAPFPPRWEPIVLSPTAAAWEAALARHAVPGHLVFVSTLNRDSAKAAVEAAGRTWVLAALDTPGPDTVVLVAGAVDATVDGVDYEAFIERIRCLWCQLLVPKLCPACAAPATLDAASLQYLLPGESNPPSCLQEVGCEECGWRGTESLEGIADVMIFPPASRRPLSAALLRDEPFAPPADTHASMQGHARELLAAGRVGVRTYRDMVRRNPLLRAQGEVHREQDRSRRMGSLFDKFLSPEVKARLLENDQDAVIKGESREVSCLFCDIRGFTARAEVRDPQALFAELNHYFAEVVDAVLSNGGTLDKFIGDAVMAVFGAPVDQPDHAQRAVECALAIRRRVEDLNAGRFRDMPIAVGIGINTGRAASGCVGTDERMEYTVLGDAVNVAARLESRAAAGEILVGDATRRQLGGRYALRSVGALSLKGKAEAVQAFAVVARA